MDKMNNSKFERKNDTNEVSENIDEENIHPNK